MGFPAYRWKIYVRPLGALSYLKHVGTHWYFDGSKDLSAIRKHAKALDHLMKEIAREEQFNDKISEIIGECEHGTMNPETRFNITDRDGHSKSSGVCNRKDKNENM